MSTKKVIVDVLGGDNAPAAILDGVFMAMRCEPALELVLVGEREFIEPRLAACGIKNAKLRVEIIHTAENISCDESPVEAVRKKPNSSIVLSCTNLRSREDCAAFVSAGSTGAVLSGAVMKVGRLEGVSRPALCPMLPTKDGRGVMLIDTGANMDTKPVNLVHFALMADVYMRARGVKNPRVALVNVGVEEAKGNELTHETFKLLKQTNLNFVGNMEARDAYNGKYDILVCDGFVGNVLLKTLEGASSLFSYKLKDAMRGFGVFGKILLARRLIKMKKELSEDSAGGAVFLGVQKPIVKAHGSSNAKAFCNAILLAARAGQYDMGEQIKQSVSEFNAKTL